jgi:hypothetical protein
VFVEHAPYTLNPRVFSRLANAISAVFAAPRVGKGFM